MKPLKMIINAFGPYIDKTEIDFTKLGDNGLYLITGDTGAGKTTIFDALSFALYGEASGKARSNSQTLRSDFAKDDNPTYVELEFLHNGEKYYIKRECGYKKINKNGNVTSVSEKVELIKPNKQILSNLSEVDKEVINILGIDKNQFAQIVMIAQGEFERFLLAPTKDKKEIFRKIFNTYLYDYFQIKLKDMLDTKVQEKSQKELLLSKNIELILADTDELELLKEEKNIYNLDELITALDKSIKNDGAELKELEKSSEKEQKELTKLSQKVKEAEIVEADRQSLNQMKINLPKIKKEVEETANNYKKEKSKDKERENLTISIEKLTSDLKEYKELEKKQQELGIKKKELKNSETQLKKIEKEINELDKNYEKNKKEFSKLKDVDVKFAKLESKLEKNNKEKEGLEQIQAEIVLYRKEQDKLEKQSKTAVLKQENYMLKRELAESLYNQFLSNQAGIMAQMLKEGTKCPVCGSKKHPQLAKLSKNAVTQKELDKANKEAEKAQKESIEESKIMASIEANIKNFESNLLKFAKSEFKMKVIEGLEEKVEIALDKNIKEEKELNKESADLKIKIKRKAELEKSIEDFDSEKNRQQEKLNKEQRNQTEITKLIASLNATIEEKQAKLQYKTAEKAEEVLEANKTLLEEMKKALEKAEKAKNESTQKLSETEGRIKELEKKTAKKDVVDISKLKADFDEKQNALNEKTKRNRDIFNRHKTNKTVLENIVNGKKEWENLSNKIQILDNLSRTANGTLTGGKQKISFENYVLAAYFDEIIVSANKRFKEMTSYQFELRRNLEKSGGGQTGLDLDVFDAYTTKVRTINSLSGGEKFKAALALSLGLSDIIQCQAGGVQIEAMFIDEGFGSLDSESLEQTMKVLQELSGNKTLIGIISHVEALREKIERKITVTKTTAGSKLKIL